MPKFQGMNYEVSGQGRAILLLHGWGASINCFAQINRELSQDFKVFAIDFKGFGASEPPKQNATIFDYAQDISKFIDCVIKEPVVLVGHSFGGRVSLILAQHLLVNKIILVDSAGLKPKINLSKRIKILKYKRAKKQVQLGKRPASDLLKFGSKDYLALNQEMRKVFVNVVNQDLSEFAKKINKPTLILWGKSDKETPIYMARKLHRITKNSKLEILSGAHFVFLDNPHQFLKATYNFLLEGEQNV